MKTPRLLTLLALSAAGGTAVFFVFALPRCSGPAGGTAGEQHRAHAAAVQAGETMDAAAANTPEHLREELAARRAAEEKAAAVRRAQRGFLIWPGRWEKTMKSRLQRPSTTFTFYVKKTADRLLEGAVTEGMDDLFIKPLICRSEVDFITRDLTALTPEAKAEWDTWQAKGWDGFASPLTRKTSLVSIFGGLATPDPRQQANADLRDQCRDQIHALLDAIEEEAKLNRPVPGENPNTPPPPEPPAGPGDRLSRMRAAVEHYRDQIDALAAWAQAGWQQVQADSWTPDKPVPPPPPLILRR